MHGDRWIEEKVKRLVANELDELDELDAGSSFSDVDVDLASTVEISSNVTSGILSPQFGYSQAPNVSGTSVTWYYLGGNELSMVGRTNDVILTKVLGYGSGGSIKKENSLIGLMFTPNIDVRARSRVNLDITQHVAGGGIDNDSSYTNIDKGGYESLETKTRTNKIEGEDAQETTTKSNQFITHVEKWVDDLKNLGVAYVFDSTTKTLKKSDLQIVFTRIEQDYEASNLFKVSGDTATNVYSVRVSGTAPVGQFTLWLITSTFSPNNYRDHILAIRDNQEVWSHTWDSQNARITDYLRSVGGNKLDNED